MLEVCPLASFCIFTNDTETRCFLTADNLSQKAAAACRPEILLGAYSVLANILPIMDNLPASLHFCLKRPRMQTRSHDDIMMLLFTYVHNRIPMDWSDVLASCCRPARLPQPRRRPVTASVDRAEEPTES